jgi:CheY-like chemotaxis protein
MPYRRGLGAPLRPARAAGTYGFPAYWPSANGAGRNFDGREGDVTANPVTHLIMAVAQLVGVLIWPALILFVLVHFRSGFADFLDHLGEFSVKALGTEISAKRQEAVAAIGAAIGAHGLAEAGPGSAADPRDVAEALPSVRAQRRMEGARVLWVDDRPDNNRYERQALEALGLRIELSTSTEDALEKIHSKKYRLIISDMGRPPDAQAGYTLLRELREAGYSTPFVIYASSRDPQHVREARQRGALGATNSPQELLEMVTGALA